MLFPTTSILDNFNRADIDPISGNWLGPFRNTNLPRIVSNTWTATNFGTSDSYWNAVFGPDSEAYATIAGTPASFDTFQINIRGQQPGSSTADGYACSLFNTGCQIVRIDDGVATQLGASPPDVRATGETWGVSAVGRVISLWKNGTLVASRNDSTYPSAGSIGLGSGASSNTCQMDDFGGGTITPTITSPQWDRLPKPPVIGGR